MNDKSTAPISKGFEEKKLKARNVETTFVGDFQTGYIGLLHHTVVDR